jgi:hypothetical protein
MEAGSLELSCHAWMTPFQHPLESITSAHAEMVKLTTGHGPVARLGRALESAVGRRNPRIKVDVKAFMLTDTVEDCRPICEIVSRDFL